MAKFRDCIKGLKLRRIKAYCGGAAVHKAPQYMREKKSLLCTAAIAALMGSTHTHTHIRERRERERKRERERERESKSYRVPQ